MYTLRSLPRPFLVQSDSRILPRRTVVLYSATYQDPQVYFATRYASAHKKCQHHHHLGHSGSASEVAPAFRTTDQDEGDLYKYMNFNWMHGRLNV